MPFALLPLLLNLAPTVASWVLGDKTGAAVEKVAGIAKDMLGTDSANDVERAIAQDPNVALQFKMALIQAETDARRQEHEALLAQIRDVQDARNQTVKLAEAKSPLAWGAAIVSTVLMTGIIVLLWFVLKNEIPEKQRELVGQLLFLVIGYGGSVINYYLGSSAGSAQKNAALEKILASRNQPSS